MSYREWKLKNDFNPFNTFKILKHVDYWKKINIANNVYVPPPIAVTIDPCNCCNYRCIGCNAFQVIQNSADSKLSPVWVENTIAFLKEWGVKSVTFAGGGEPLMIQEAQRMLAHCMFENMPFGVITNGYYIDKHLEFLRYADWIGVSVDASSPETYAKIKNTKESNFDVVINNVSSLTELNENVTYKYLINKHNIQDIYGAVKLAKEIGCKMIHVRPIGTAWYENKMPIFSPSEVEMALAEITQARSDFEDDKFRVFGVTHKFGKNWKVCNSFKKCWACFMYLVIQPGGIISTCCDNRGNPMVELATNLEKPEDILNYWGTDKHVKLFESIDVNKCPRCTFNLHNQCYEQCILKDEMLFDFI